MGLITWNMQGANDGKWLTAKQLLKNDNQIVCLQECGVPPGFDNQGQQANGLFLWNENIGTQFRPFEITIVYWYNLIAANPRCSLAIICIQGLINNTFIDFVPNIQRPVIGVQLNINNNIWVNTIHSPAAANAAQVSMQYINLLNPQNNFLCLGDFNCEPGAIHAQGVPLANVVAPPYATQQGGGTIDYLVNFSAPHLGIQADQNPGPMPMSDHVAVRFHG